MPEIKRKSIDIPMDKIDYNPENTSIFNMGDIESLAKRIEEEGFTSAILVFQKSDGRYEILSGHRRYEAMKLLKSKKIPADVLSGISSDTQRDLILLSSNMANRKLAPIDMARAIEFYKGILKRDASFKGDKRKAIAEYFGITPSNVYRYEVILKLIPELQELCTKPNFPYSALTKAASLSNKEQKQLYDELMNRLDTEQDRSEDHADATEKVFSRTTVEQIINNTIRASEYTKRKEQHDKERDVFPMPAPIEDDEFDDAEVNINNYIIKDDDNDEIVDLKSFMEQGNRHKEDSFSFAGLDQCITMVKEYQKSAKSISNKEAIKDKIQELKQAIEKLEKSL